MLNVDYTRSTIHLTLGSKLDQRERGEYFCISLGDFKTVLHFLDSVFPLHLHICE